MILPKRSERSFQVLQRPVHLTMHAPKEFEAASNIPCHASDFTIITAYISYVASFAAAPCPALVALLTLLTVHLRNAELHERAGAIRNLHHTLALILAAVSLDIASPSWLQMC